MRTENFPDYRGQLEYVCVNCGARFAADTLLYVCPHCGGVFLLEDARFDDLAKLNSGAGWREIFAMRLAAAPPALRGIFVYYELLAPVLDEEDIVTIGEGKTPLVSANNRLAASVGVPFAFKNEGQNPSASFKDRGMACAFSFIKRLARIRKWEEVLTICASTGDTSAAAALYAAYVGAPLKSVVILPRGKVTPQQLSQPLGSGATVIEIPGVFDDCMKVVENLAENYRVALLNSKNPWRLLGQESYACEVAQALDWNLRDVSLFVPIGNAGNIAAIMSGLLKLRRLNVIGELPRVFGVQSERANPVFRYYNAPEEERVWSPVEVRPSVAQAAMIGNPVSFPRVALLAGRYMEAAGPGSFNVVEASEQEIMDAMLEANRNGHIACTQGGECLAGLRIARKKGLLGARDFAVLDSTAHALKFMDFQNGYFADALGPEYGVKASPNLTNKPAETDLTTKNMKREEFWKAIADEIAKKLDLGEAR